ncbi:MAG: S8 family peptidase [Muribaculaceae bacterium]|nr:S8 family peptidase [Muribaculaceae bacterium]MCM1398985.1 S8 family peptidase [Clostridium sp.]MCM1458843.1 S8 family peptidase [Bacteroides sp.]
MDNGCAEYVYSEDYISFLVRYDNDIQGVYENFEPDCVTIINNQFLVVYKKRTYEDEGDIFKYGYQVLPKCYGLMDEDVVRVTGAERLRSFPGLGLNGTGVLIGFVDTGIDIGTPIFRRTDGTTRIAAIWDQNEAVYGMSEAFSGYGAVFTRTQINDALQTENPYEQIPSIDEDGHGTFMASVAAGNDGMAPDSEIIMVKLRQVKDTLRKVNLIPEDVKCFSEDDVMLGVKFLMRQAAELGRPIVICMGIGTNQGDHAGNTYLEMYLNSFIGLRGAAIIAAAGNETGYGTHYEEMTIEESYRNVEIAVGSNDKGFVLELWGKSPGFLDIEIVSPTGEVFSNIPVTRSGEASRTFLYEGTTVDVQTLSAGRETGDPCVFMRFMDPTEGIWVIRISGQGSTGENGFNMWLPIHNFLNSDTRFAIPEPNITICAPGNTQGVITAAGYDYNTNAIYVNSSRGYTRNGRIKPDMAAPAVDIEGVFAGRGTGSTQTVLYTRRSGTSIASAVVAGGSALIIQWGVVNGNSPLMTSSNVKQMLIRGANRVNPLSYPNRIWGYGVLDLFGAFEALRD